MTLSAHSGLCRKTASFLPTQEKVLKRYDPQGNRMPLPSLFYVAKSNLYRGPKSHDSRFDAVG
jgi:hypothetical protein